MKVLDFVYDHIFELVGLLLLALVVHGAVTFIGWLPILTK